jgi:hypothetical protein
MNASFSFDSYGLDIRMKSAFIIFNHVHTDTAGFFGKSFAGDCPANNLSFATHCANVAHFYSPVTNVMLWVNRNPRSTLEL